MSKFTTLFAASMAVVNFDIKRVLAFSTISQLAYMFLGLGAGAYIMATDVSRGENVNSAGYSAALYHLFNHAFFKALLFLGAGSVIHAAHTNDMREMGGLSKPLPVTSKAMLLGALALAGIVPFSGFFSKGEILSVTFDAGSEQPGFYWLWALGVGTAFLTAFYAFRLWFMTFHGEYRGHEHRVAARHDGTPHDPRRIHSRIRPPRLPDAGIREPGLLRTARSRPPVGRHPGAGLPARGRLDGRRGLGPGPRLGGVRDEAPSGGTVHGIERRCVHPPHAHETV